jgi:hypothetical protein
MNVPRRTKRASPMMAAADRMTTRGRAAGAGCAQPLQSRSRSSHRIRMVCRSREPRDQGRASMFLVRAEAQSASLMRRSTDRNNFAQIKFLLPRAQARRSLQPLSRQIGAEAPTRLQVVLVMAGGGRRFAELPKDAAIRRFRGRIAWVISEARRDGETAVNCFSRMRRERVIGIA